MIAPKLTNTSMAVTPDELAVLYDVFQHACALEGIPRDHPDAETVASGLIALHQQGVKGRQNLLTQFLERASRTQSVRDSLFISAVR